ncbi:MAG TPA: YsnF/AvaK domain-containing protein [Pyrinomonadaceae bacterium]
MTKTIVGLFDEYREAQRAVVELVEVGIPREDIGITSRDYTNYDEADTRRDDSYRDDEGVGDKISNFFSRLFGDDAENASHYSEAVGGGGTVVTVDCETEETADRAEAILNRFGGDVDERGETHREAAYVGTTDNVETNRADLAEGGEARIPVIEEELRVGKREVEGGGVRVRTRVVERPVEEAVRLREERVNVERRPVNRPVSEADISAFREGTFELRERSEEAVVDKTARVVEEVAINKEVGERTETVRDTVRKTDVDVEETAGTKVRRATATGRADDIDIDRRDI